ncbi:MAG: holo-ACP synthase, partial [Lentisphaeria bacterium]|nr:holo-ACP synthase [Lentisphaeria bacterium]
CGIGEHCALTDMEILNDPQGKPEVTLSGAARATADRLKVARIHISISHEKQYAVATALLESAERG